MYFGANKMPVEVVREGAFGGTYFRDIQMLVKNGTKIHGKDLISLKILMLNFMHQIKIDKNLNRFE